MPVFDLTEDSQLEEFQQSNVDNDKGWLIKIPDVKVPWVVLESKVYTSWVHWVSIGKSRVPVVCKGDIVTSKGFDPETCPLCSYMLEQYQHAKDIAEKGDEDKAKIIRENTNALRARKENKFIVCQGHFIRVSHPGKGKISEADFDFTATDDQDKAKFGYISLGSNHWKQLETIVFNGSNEEVKSFSDMMNHYWISKREESQDRQYTGKKIVWSIGEKIAPDIFESIKENYPKELKNYNLEETLSYDDTAMKKAVSSLKGDKTQESKEESSDKPKEEDIMEEFVDDLPL